MTVKKFDVAVIGAGPNGLICSAYLARAGLKVILLERRHECGGGLDTLELAGFKYNPHAIYHMLAELMPPYTDFDLANRGVRYIFPAVQVAYARKKDDPVILYQNHEQTAAHVAQIFDSQQATAYLQMQTDFSEFFQKILLPLTYVPPVPALEQVQAIERAGDVGQRFNEISEMTPLEILESYGLCEPLQAAIFNLFAMWGMSNFDGLGFLFPLYANRMTQAALVAGGSHRLSSALHKAAIQAGATIEDQAEVAKVNLHNGRVCGLALNDGTQIDCDRVASTVDPKQNFLRFFSAEELPEDLIHGAKNWEWEKVSLFGLHTSLQQAPQYIGSESYSDLNQAMITFLGLPDTESMLDHQQQIEEGEIPTSPYGHATCASLFDPIQAFAPFHTGRFESLAPFDHDWDSISDEYAALCLASWRKYAPNIQPMDQLIYPPTHIQKKLINMGFGSIKHGAYTALQMGYNRPHDTCSQCITPIEGFYVCGASTYPGGMVIAGPGYLGANTICDELAIRKPWNEPTYVQNARALGIIED